MTFGLLAQPRFTKELWFLDSVPGWDSSNLRCWAQVKALGTGVSFLCLLFLLGRAFIKAGSRAQDPLLSSSASTISSTEVHRACFYFCITRETDFYQVKPNVHLFQYPLTVIDSKYSLSSSSEQDEHGMIPLLCSHTSDKRSRLSVREIPIGGL